MTATEAPEVAGEEWEPPAWTQTVEDAELPPAASAITPDHTASAPRGKGRRAPRVPRVGSLREQFRDRKGRGGSGAPRNRPASAPKATAKARSGVPNRKGQFVKPLTQFYTMVGIATTSKDEVCGPAIIAQAEACARAIDDLAYTNEALRSVLWSLTQTGMLTKIVAAHAPILFAVGMHHSNRFRSAIDNTQMGEFIASMLKSQAEAVREALAREAEGEDDGDDD